MGRRRIGIVGYGHLGEYLVKEVLSSGDLDLAFVWNRTASVLDGKVENQYVLHDLDAYAERNADLIVEVAHPDMTKTFGERFLEAADYMIGSPTALADAETELKLRSAATRHGLYIPTGALWGGEDIRKMAEKGSLQALSKLQSTAVAAMVIAGGALKITIMKPPESFKLMEPLKRKLLEANGGACVLYDGPVRELCPLAPNNVNTMAAAAVAAHNLGFDKTMGSIVADPSLTNWHIVQVDVWGPGDIAAGTAFHCQTVRRNPAIIGQVTGSATYASFMCSVNAAFGKGPGVHLC